MDCDHCPLSPWRILLSLSSICLLTGAGPTRAENVTVRLDTRRCGWQTTGVALSSGDNVTIEAEGVITYASGARSDPDGCLLHTPDPCAARYKEDPRYPVPVEDAWVVSLVGRVGRGSGFFVGSQKSFTADVGGELQLAYNDSYCSDNSGSFTVTINVSSPGQRQPSSTINVRGDGGWQRTGVFVDNGDHLRVKASGRVKSDPGASTSDPDGCWLNVADPCGSRYNAASGCLVPGAWKGSLVAKIDDGPGFFVGADADLTAGSAGELFLGFNDDYFGDNKGRFRVEIDVISPEKPQTRDGANCYNGIWKENEPNQFRWSIDLRNDQLRIARTDGFVNGIFARSGAQWVGTLTWANGELWRGVVLYRPSEDCSELRTNQSWWFKR